MPKGQYHRLATQWNVRLDPMCAVRLLTAAKGAEMTVPQYIQKFLIANIDVIDPPEAT